MGPPSRRPGDGAAPSRPKGGPGSPSEALDALQPASTADRKAAGRLLPPGRRRFVGHDGVSIAPSSLLAGQQNPTRHDRLQTRVRTLSALARRDSRSMARQRKGGEAEAPNPYWLPSPELGRTP